MHAYEQEPRKTKGGSICQPSDVHERTIETNIEKKAQTNQPDDERTRGGADKKLHDCAPIDEYNKRANKEVQRI